MPLLSASRQRPEAQVRSRSTDSAAVTATGTTFWAAAVSGKSSNAASLAQARISAPGGLLDDDGVSLEAYSLRDRIAEYGHLQARCVLVDEVQDCSTVELAVIGKIPSLVMDGLFLTGDPVQKVFPKQHDLVQADIDIVGRGTILRKNYRNSRQILEAAFKIINHFRGTAPLPEEEILSPDYAYRDGQRPVIYHCRSQQEQRDVVTWYLGLLKLEEFDSTCIASPSSQVLDEFETTCISKGWPVFRITGESVREGLIGPGLKLSLLPDLKGFEFQKVFLVNVMDSQLLTNNIPWDERWRVAFQLYVAMTRARDELIITYVLNPSVLLGPLEDSIDECIAGQLLET